MSEQLALQTSFTRNVLQLASQRFEQLPVLQRDEPIPKSRSEKQVISKLQYVLSSSTTIAIIFLPRNYIVAQVTKKFYLEINHIRMYFANL